METEKAPEQPDISSQDSPMKTFTTELNTLKRHFPTVKSVNGESPSSNNADIAAVVNTIKAVTAACQGRGLEEHKTHSENDAINDSLTGTSSVDESTEENKLNGSEQISKDKNEPENKRVKLCDEENTNNDSEPKADENELKEIHNDRNKSSPENDKNSNNEHKSVEKVGACSSKEDCNCGEESELKLQIEASPEKGDENHYSDLEKLRKPENCFTPIKNHQCSSDEARKSPFLIGDKIRNSLKGIVEKVKSSPDHKRNLCSLYLDDKDDKLLDQDKGYYSNDKIIAQDPVSPKFKMNDSAIEVCDKDDENSSNNISEMACVQSKNIENDNVTDQNNHIPTDSVRLKENDSELVDKSADEQELLLGIEDDTHMDISSDKEDELLQESASDTELNNESVVYLGEEINGHDNEMSDLTSKNTDRNSEDDPLVSGNSESNDDKEESVVGSRSPSAARADSLDSKQEKVPNEVEEAVSTKFHEEDSNNSNDSKSTSDSKSISDSNFEENSNDAVDKISDNGIEVDETSSDSTKEIFPTEVNTNNNFQSSTDQSAANMISKDEENPVQSQVEEDDIIFEGYDSPKSKHNEDSKKDASNTEIVASAEKLSDLTSGIENDTNNQSSSDRNKETILRIDSDVSLIAEADLVSENNTENKPDKEQTENSSVSSKDDDIRKTDPTTLQTTEKNETDKKTDEKDDKMEEDEDDDDVIFEGVVKSPVSESDKSLKRSEETKVLNGKESVSDTNEKSGDIPKSDTDESKKKQDDDHMPLAMSVVNQNDQECQLKMSVDEENDDDDDDVIFEGEDKPNDKQVDQTKSNSVTDHSVSKHQDEPKNDASKIEKDKSKDNKVKVADENKDEKSSETKMEIENSKEPNSNQKPEVKSSLKRPAETNSDQSSNPKRTRLDEVIGKLGSAIGVEPESIEVSESEDEEEESATDTAVEEKSEGTATSDNDDDETETASDNEKVKYIRITEKQLEDLIQERVAAYLSTQRETLLGQMTQKIKNLQISNEQWKDQVRELQIKVTDVTVLNLKHEKRKAATAALRQITTRSVSVQVDEGKTASASKQSAQKSEPPANIARTPPRRPTVQQKSPLPKSPLPLVTAPLGSNGTIRLPIPQSSIAPPVLAPQMPQLPQPAVVSTTHYQTPSVKSLLDTTRQQITSGSLTKTTPATSVQYPQRVVAQTKTGYVTMTQSSAAVSVTTAVTMATKTVAPSMQMTSPTGLKIIDLTMDETDNRQPKMLAVPAAQMQTLNQLRPVMQPQQQFVLNQNGQLIQTSTVGSTGQPAFQLVFNSATPAIRASVPQSGTVLQSVPQQNVTMTSPVGAQQLVTQVQGVAPGQTILRPPPTSSTQITSLLSQTKSKETGTPPKGQSQTFEERIRPALRKKLETTVTVPTVNAHPAPLPATPGNQPSAGLKLLPPKPSLKISRVSQGIVLSWNMTVNESHAEIASYQLFAYQEGSTPPTTALWKKVGDVKALPLPMACTLTQFQVGNKYHFAVRAVDASSRVGLFSEYSSIHLTPMTTATGKS